MELQALAARDSAAQKRIIEAATQLAERLGVQADVSRVRIKTREAQVKAMLQREQLADLLEQLVDKALPGRGLTLEQLAQVPGIGEATMAKIKAYAEQLP